MLAQMSKDVIIFGKDGFLGSALSKQDLPDGVYYFDSPSSNVQFDENIEWCMSKTVGGFIDILNRCKKTGEYLVYPSSATVYNKNTSYARCKAVLEELALAYDIPALGLRISAGYGVGEAHKGPFASVVYQWCQEMKEGKRPIIYGDGTQTRDFIYEDDIAENIADLARRRITGIVDIGTGVNTSFNEVVHTINKVLKTDIQPIYVPKPKNYVPETKVVAVPTKIKLIDGIRKVLNA